MKSIEEQKVEMLNKFDELKKTGGRITLGDTMTTELKNEFNQRIKEEDRLGLEMQTSLLKSILTRSESLDTEYVKYIKKDINKFYKKLSKSPKVTELEMIGEFVFGFVFENEKYAIAYDFVSECITLTSDFNDSKKIYVSEIGYYELEEKYF